MSVIEIPVSFGEAVDKLTILEIKRDQIPSKSEYVVKEIEEISVRLYSDLHGVPADSVAYLKGSLKHVNFRIWTLQDEFRLEPNPSERSILCERIIELNDARFRLKRKIDALFNSAFREQKSYEKKRLFFLGHLGAGDQISVNAIVRYFACFYDEVTVVTKAQTSALVRALYRDDPSISTLEVDSDSDISPSFGFSPTEFKRITEGCTVITLGLHSCGLNKTFSNLPFCFYDELGLDVATMFIFSYIRSSEAAMLLFREISTRSFCVLHSESSEGPVFGFNDIARLVKIDPDQTIVLDINKSIYSVEHPFYSIASRFAALSLPDYEVFVRNADSVFVSDSALFCLILTMEIRAKVVYYRARYNRDYDYVNDYRIANLGADKAGMFVKF